MFWFVTDHENSRHRNHVAGAFQDFCQTPDLGLRLGVDFTFAW